MDADVVTDLKKDDLLKIVDGYDGIAVRSSTKITAEVIKAASRLRVVGRAGIGVDNVDIPRRHRRRDHRHEHAVRKLHHHRPSTPSR